MRILFTALPGYGLFLSTLPLAWAARAAGHEVLLVNNGPAVEAISHAGLPVIDPRPDQDLWAALMTMIQQKGAGERGAVAPTEADRRAMLGSFATRFGLTMGEETVRIARAFRPDIVVSTLEQATGALVAADLEVPLIEHGIRLAWAGEDEMAMTWRQAGAEVMEPLREKLGIPRPLPAPTRTLDIRPPSLGGHASETQMLMRFVPYNGERALPEWVLTRGERPRVCVTLGTVLPLVSALEAFREMVGAIAESGVEVVLLQGERETLPLDSLPANVRAARWLPLNALMPTCAAIVHHGGAGTSLTALTYGVPQVVLPRSADQPANADLIARRGVGLSLAPEEATPAVLTAHLNRVRETPGFLAAAEEVRREIAAQPSPAAIIDLLAARWA